ncbi:type VI secretion system tip protein TssI/VgrG [Hafnia paralvei]|uniref:type VI secretion system tip protein TssI/VgrG n=1 Tax=Hafnia paralvei TaxID=546367 RepID=UPI0029DE4636|nr:type VI secretion system tip protein TssI/VgrG [Hafnia paralvei]MDX6840105.1 type VI secretion system tip protein TssI/VgrG [Hafnia paralvei]
MADNTGLQFTFTTQSLPEKTFSVVSFALNEGLSQIYSLDVELASITAEIAFSRVLDESGELQIWYNGEIKRRVNGIITRFSHSDTGNERTRYSVTLRPQMWLLSLDQSSRIFQQQTPQQIITTLLQKANIISFNFQLRYEHPTREYCVQYRESTLAFIERLAAEEGISWYFHFDNDKQEIVFVDDCTFLPMGETLPYNPHQRGLSEGASIQRFSYEENVRPAQVLLKDHTFKNPAWEMLYQQHSKSDHQRSEIQHYDYPGRYKTDFNGQAYSGYRLDALRQDAMQARGRSDSPSLMGGQCIIMQQHPNEAFNQRWQIVSLLCEGQQPESQKEEAGVSGTYLESQIVVIPDRQTWRPMPDPRPRVDGPQIAVVVGPENEEIYCDEVGRVKVQFPWDLEGKGNETSSCWIRVAQSWAGSRYGAMSVPRIGHEVIVDFLEGDPDQPIITGRTYHVVNVPPHALPVHKTRTVLRTDTHKGAGYNELSFEDEQDKQLIYLHAQKDLQTEVKNNQYIMVEQDRSKIIKHDQTEEIGNDKTSDVTHDHIERIHHDQMINVMHNQQIQVDNQYLFHVLNQRKDQMGADFTEEIAGDHHHTVAGTYELLANKKVLINTNDLVLQGAQSVVLQGPGGKIVIDSSGITLSSPIVNIKALTRITSGGGSSMSALGATAMNGDPLSEICPICLQSLE